MTMATVGRKEFEIPLNEGLYHLEPEEKEFFDRWTGIHDDEELKRHILDCQTKAYAIFPYPCIRIFSFLRCARYAVAGYQDLLKLGRERKDAIFIEFAACFGQELRKVVQDGFPLENIVATDVNPGYWELGHQLFNSTPQTFPVPFVPADIFNDTDLAPAAPATTPPSTPHPDLRALRTLTPLHGRAAAIHAASFFHLFSEDAQRTAARKLGTLLSPERGSIIFGDHIGLPHKGRLRDVRQDARWDTFCYGPESWRELWDGDVFPKGSVSVQAELTELAIVEEPGKPPRVLPFMMWCVTRL